jgi:protein-disulfide isomerase
MNTLNRLVLVTLWAAVALGAVSAQQIGDEPALFVDATAAVSNDDDSYAVGPATVTLQDATGVLTEIGIDVPLTDDGAAAAADILAIATGYGEGIREPLLQFLADQAPTLVGEGPVTIQVEAFAMSVDVTGADTPQAQLGLKRLSYPGDAFGAPAGSIGPDDAAVTVRVFSDFECPFCRRYALEVQPMVEDTVLAGADVRFEFHHLPLTSIHTNAQPAAEAAQCVQTAAGQDAFWAFHDRLFETQDAWAGAADADAQFSRTLASVLDGQPEAQLQAESCIEERASRDAVEASTARARELGVSGTPTVFVGPYRMTNFGDAAAYQRLIRLTEAQAERP